MQNNYINKLEFKVLNTFFYVDEAPCWHSMKSRHTAHNHVVQQHTNRITETNQNLTNSLRVTLRGPSSLDSIHTHTGLSPAHPIAFRCFEWKVCNFENFEVTPSPKWVFTAIIFSSTRLPLNFLSIGAFEIYLHRRHESSSIVFSFRPLQRHKRCAAAAANSWIISQPLVCSN